MKPSESLSVVHSKSNCVDAKSLALYQAVHDELEHNTLMDDNLKDRFYGYKRDALYPVPPADPYVPPLTRQEWRNRYRARLAWSNSEASDDVLLRKALTSGSWHIVLSSARLFGTQRLEDIYHDMTTDDQVFPHQRKREFLEVLLKRARHGLFE